jgi:hypothetical protein
MNCGRLTGAGEILKKEGVAGLKDRETGVFKETVRGKSTLDCAFVERLIVKKMPIPPQNLYHFFIPMYLGCKFTT